MSDPLDDPNVEFTLVSEDAETPFSVDVQTFEAGDDVPEAKAIGYFEMDRTDSRTKAIAQKVATETATQVAREVTFNIGQDPNFVHNLGMYVRAVMAKDERERIELDALIEAGKWKNRYPVRFRRNFGQSLSFCAALWVVFCAGAAMYSWFGYRLEGQPVLTWAIALLTPVLLGALLTALISLDD